jgi:cytoskeletal protein CcmA (bactofilin family)
VKGPVFSKEIVIKDTGSISGEIEADRVEIYGHLDGKVAAKSIVIGSTGVVKGDLLFSESLRTEEGAEIDGYIKKVSSIEKDESKIKELLFPSSENQEKKSKKTAKSQSVNKESEVLA